MRRPGSTTGRPRDELTLLDLLDHLRTGRLSTRTSGEPEHVRAQRAEHDEEHLPYVLGPLANLPELAEAEVVGVWGLAAPTLAAALAGARAGRVVHCVVEPADRVAVSAWHAALPEAVRTGIHLHETGPDAGAELPWADTWVLSSLVNGRDDRSLTALLARVSAAADQVVLMTHAADDATIDDHTAVDALVDMVTTGAPTGPADSEDPAA